MSVEVFERHRARLQGIAYGMLGSVMEAEDVVQDAYLRWAEIDQQDIESPAAYLTTITTRLAIDRLRSARARRESYIGPWLPEPVIGAFAPDPADVVAEAESLSMAMLSALEPLKPVERAVLLLREVFDLDYTEIADIVDKSPANTRQIATRARGRAGELSRPRRPDLATEQRIISQYVDAVVAGDVDLLSEVFAADVVLWSDGGGKVRAARHPLHGSVRVARHLIGVSPQAPEGTEIRIVRANGDPSLMAFVGDSTIAVVSFEVDGDVVVAVRAVLNPDKLAHLSAG